MKPYNLKDIAIELSIPMNANFGGAAIDLRDINDAMITTQWSGATSTDGVFWIEISNTGAGNWELFPGSQYPVLTPGGAHHWDWFKRACPFVRVYWSRGSNSAGLYAVTAWLET